MRIYSGQVNMIARDIIDTLDKKDVIDVEEELHEEAIADLGSVLREYIRTNREISEEARDQARARGGGAQVVQRIKRKLAKERRFAYGEDSVDWIVEQMIEILLYSANIEEVYEDDRGLRREINLVLKRYDSDEDAQLKKEAEGKIKNLEAGSVAWDIEYQRLMENLKRQRGLED